MRKKAEMGIGTLIIFIAMILVAAIAAGVLIQTASSLQNKALLTGERSKSQVSTQVVPVTIYGEDGTDGNVETFYAKVKLGAGSDALHFDDMLIDFSLKNLSQDMITHSASMNCNETNGTYFTTTHLVQGDNYDPSYLQRGDIVQICFESTRSVGEDENVEITIMPKIGTPTTIDSVLSGIITQKRVSIYP